MMVLFNHQLFGDPLYFESNRQIELESRITILNKTAKFPIKSIQIHSPDRMILAQRPPKFLAQTPH